MKKSIFLLLPLLLCASAFGQTTWYKVAHDGDSISIPAGTTLRYGASAGTPFGCGTGPALAATVWVTPTKLGSTVTPAALGVADPANCYVKELDVLQTSVAQTVTVNGKPMTVPALPVVVVTPPPVTKPTISKQWQCSFPAGTLTYSLMSDGTFQLANPLPIQITGCTETK